MSSRKRRMAADRKRNQKDRLAPAHAIQPLVRELVREGKRAPAGWFFGTPRKPG